MFTQPLNLIGAPFKWKFNPTIYGVWFTHKNKWHLYDHSQIYKYTLRTGNKTNGGRDNVFILKVAHYTHCGIQISRKALIRTKFNLFCLYPIYKRGRFPIPLCPICYAKVIQRLKDDGFYKSQCDKERSKLRRRKIRLKDESAITDQE
jgi:hypothetical protein